MKLLFKSILIICVVLFVSCNTRKHANFSGIDYSINKYDKNLCCCKYFTLDNSRFWKQDSLGLNGYRRTITPLLQSECLLSGTSWRQIETFFGFPKTVIDNLRSHGKEVIIYVFVIYQASTRPEDQYKNMYFDIVVDKLNNELINTTIRYIDG